MTYQSRRRKTNDPCPRCGLHRDRCLCSLIPEINIRTRVTLIIHSKELKRTTNSGRLAVDALKNSEVVVRGARSEREKPLDLSSVLKAGYQPLFFFPLAGATELTEAYVSSFDRPIQLLVPDGNWRQASKVYGRHSELSEIKCVKISDANDASYHLRAEHRKEGMSTLEAIAKAVGIIESREAEQKLLALYAEKLRRTLEGRGVKIDATSK